MGGRVLAAVLAVSTAVLAGPGWAGGPGGGFHGGGVQGGGGFHGGGFRYQPVGGRPGGFGGAYRGGGYRGGPAMPPVAGVIHERPGMRPSYSAYGHTGTGYRPGGGQRFGFRGDVPRGGFRYGSGGYAPGGYGHVATGFRGGGFGRTRFGGRWDRGRFADGRRYPAFRFVGGYGGGYYGGAGLYGNGGYPDGVGAYGSNGDTGTYGSPGTYGDGGTYGGLGTQAGYGGPYLSEPPLAATRTEAPLAPSPYGPDGGYYETARHFRPRILTVERSARAGCDCGAHASAYPVIYRYGVGTAY